MKINVIIGPTASGKSALAVARALKDGGIVINADAMQCYDALPILTAQPTQSETQGVPHQLYATLKATDSLTAADWVAMAKTEIEKALNQNRTPYLVGGTGLYIKAMMDGLSPIPDIPVHIRANVRGRLHTDGLANIYADLQMRDPTMAAKLKAGDTQRILRAMEVLEATGKSLATWQAIPPQKPNPDWQFHIIQMLPDRVQEDIKILTRLHQMVKAGTLDEVKILSDKIEAGEVPAKALVTVAHGFKHFRRVLKNEMTLDTAIELTAIETRQYAKRQRTWCRHQITPDEIIT